MHSSIVVLGTYHQLLFHSRNGKCMVDISSHR